MNKLEYYQKNYPRLVGFLQTLPAERLAYINSKVGEKWLSEVLTPEELDAAAELICEAAPANIRMKYPIIDSYLESQGGLVTQELPEDIQ